MGLVAMGNMQRETLLGTPIFLAPEIVRSAVTNEGYNEKVILVHNF